MVDYSTRIGLEKQDTGANFNTWGQRVNTNVIDLLDEARAGVEAITVSGTVTLSNTNATTNQARQPVHVLTGTGGTVNVPNKENHWWVVNNCSAAVSYAVSGGASVSVAAGERAKVYCDGTNCVKVQSSVVDLSTAFQATSVTANALATGDLTYTIAAGKSFSVGMPVRITDNAAPATNYADGVVKSYASTSITITVATVTGSGTPPSVTIGFVSQDITLPADAAGFLENNGAGVKVWRGKASQAEAEAGTDNDKYMTPLRVSQAIDALGRGWDQISTQTVSGAVAAVTFTGIPQTFSEIALQITGASHDSGSSQSPSVLVSTDNGSAFSSAGVLGAPPLNSTQTLLGMARIIGYARDSAIGEGVAALTPGSSPTVAATGSTTATSHVILCTGGIDAVRFVWSGGNVDAGTFVLLGR